MHLEVSFRNLKPREEVRRRAQALFAKLERFLDPSSQATLVMGTEHGRCIAELTITSIDGTHQAQDEDEELRTALDRAFHRMETSLRRAKERRVDRWQRRVDKTDGFEEAPLVDDVVAPVAVGPVVG